MVSQGVPMFVAGDEARRTQQGNNNAYNQANEISWVDWDRIAANEPLRRFWKLLIAFRKRHAVLRRDRFFGGAPEIEWHGCNLGAPGWNDASSRVLAFTLRSPDGADALHVILNMDDQELPFELPQLDGRHWRRAFDTALPAPQDASDAGDEPVVPDASVYHAGPRSAVVLLSGV
jgi:glycogen operon protein